jgi:lysine-specific demethylase/histidyl-hydroxylase NO66
VADAATLQQLHTSDGCTLQLHQPQRFFDGCWRLLAALERQLGCLVGCNAYLTPAGTQGLAPHHDDVELWVVQTAGRKRWRLYEPRAGFHLPSVPSGDLDADTLGPVVMEVELNVGDCLYMPRGTVHQAEAVTEDSAHLTISTYQRCSYADLAMHVLQVSGGRAGAHGRLQGGAGSSAGSWMTAAAAANHSGRTCSALLLSCPRLACQCRRRRHAACRWQRAKAPRPARSCSTACTTCWLQPRQPHPPRPRLSPAWQGCV